MKKIVIFVLLFIMGYILITQFISLEVDPCDIKCDNCLNPNQCEKCYDDCYMDQTNNQNINDNEVNK
jgi:hypothetical protein